MIRDHPMAMHSSARLLSVVLLFCLLAPSAFTQRDSHGDAPQPLEGIATRYDTAPGTDVLVFTVFAERPGAHLDRQAVLKLANIATRSSTWQGTDEASHSVFVDVAYGSYDVEVSAVGYLTTHQEVQAINSLLPIRIDIVLRRDPAAINLDVADAAMSPKARRQTRHAIFDLKSGHLKDAEKELDRAYKLAPTSPDLNFLLGYLFFQKGDFAQAGTYLGTAVSLNPQNTQALTLLGRAGLAREDYPAARSALEQAVMADADNWLPHNLLADTYLRQKNYDQARDQAQIAIEKGKNVAAPAQLVLGQALVALGREQEGVQALSVFLEQSPQDPLAPQVRTLITQIKELITNPPAAESPSGSTAPVTEVDPLGALPAPGLSMKSWQPPGVDDIKPVIAPDVVCPSDQVIEESGKRMQELVQDVERFAATEDLFHEALDRYGLPIRSETRHYDYVASISEPEPGFLAVDEFRSDRGEAQAYPDQITSTGFAALALVFHPHARDNFEITCEGLGEWRGQATWIVHFRQRDDRPNRMHSYQVGHQTHPVGLKGRAWINADKFRIVRIEAEIVNPVPEIQLLSEHQIVEYGPVPFAKKNTTLWLPKSAEIYFELHKNRYHRRHSFDHYVLFSVDADEKRKEPGSKPATKSGTPEEKKS